MQACAGVSAPLRPRLSAAKFRAARPARATVTPSASGGGNVDNSGSGGNDKLAELLAVIRSAKAASRALNAASSSSSASVSASAAKPQYREHEPQYHAHEPEPQVGCTS